MRAEHDRRPQDHRIGAFLQQLGFALGFRGQVGAVRISIGTDGRDLHDPPDAHFLRQPPDPGRALGMDRIEPVLAFIDHDAHAVHHHIGIRHRGAHRQIIADIAGHRLNLADGAIGAHEKCLGRAADGDADAPALLGHTAGDLAPEESRAAINRDDL